jgi:hypothetical protein
LANRKEVESRHRSDRWRLFARNIFVKRVRVECALLNDVVLEPKMVPINHDFLFSCPDRAWIGSNLDFVYISATI